MEYKKVAIILSPYNETSAELMIAQMGEFGFDTFCENENGFEAYIPSELFDKNQLTKLEPMIDGVSFSWEIETIADQNWNKTWEDNYFTPIIVDDRCLIRSTSHEKTINAEYEILINPEMSFGSGHHETTCHMIRFILNNDFNGKDVLDMGCGTGILGILAAKKGAKNVRGIDIDEWCYKNSMENIRLNNISNMSVAVGTAHNLETESNTYDIILANINRNILLNDMHNYVNVLRPNGLLAMSGFYEQDIQMIKDCAISLRLTFIDSKIENNWTMLSFVKQ